MWRLSARVQGRLGRNWEIRGCWCCAGASAGDPSWHNERSSSFVNQGSRESRNYTLFDSIKISLLYTYRSCLNVTYLPPSILQFNRISCQFFWMLKSPSLLFKEGCWQINITKWRPFQPQFLVMCFVNWFVTHVRGKFVDCKVDGQISVCSEASLPAARLGGALFRVTATLWVKVCLYKLQQTVEGVLIIIIDMVINHREGVKMCEDISMFWSSVFYAMHVTHTTNIQEYVTRAKKSRNLLTFYFQR